MEKVKIKILPADFIYSDLYSYIKEDYDEVREIYHNVLNSKSIIIGVEKDEKIISSMVLDILNDRIHLRRTTGEFIKTTFCFDVFIEALAKFLKKSKITLTNTRINKYMTRKLNFVYNGEEYERIVNQ